MRAIVVLCILLTAIWPALADSSIDWKEKMKLELPAILDRYETRPPLASETIQITIEGSSENEPNKTETTVVFSRLDKNVMAEKTVVNSSTSQIEYRSITCRNGSYQFGISKTGDQPYKLVRFTTDVVKSIDMSSPAQMCYDALYSISSAVNNKGKVSLKEVRWDNSRSLLRVSYNVATLRNGKSLIESNVIYVDPNAHWKILERDFSVDGMSTSYKIEYGPDVSGLPYPSTVTELHYDQLKGKNRPKLMIISSFSHGDNTKHPKDFLLSTYGFEEPDVSDQQTHMFPRYAIYLTLSVLFAIIAWLLKRKLHQYGSTTSINT